MARRKRTILEDDLDSSEASEESGWDDQAFKDDPDTRAERSLFEDPYQRQKRRRVGGFNDDDDDEGFSERPATKEKKFHFSQAPSFVTGEKRSEKLDETPEEQGEDGEADEEDHEDEGTDDESLAARPIPEPRIREEQEDERPRIGTRGLGSAARRFESASILSRGGIGSGRGDLGSSPTNQGIGSRDDTGHEAATSSFHSLRGIGSKYGFGMSGNKISVPGATDAAPRHPQRSFVRNGSGSAGSTPGNGTPKLSQEERLHFSKLQSSFGAKLMAKMGWQAGAGLGASGEGIVTPVETKLRPKPSMGLAFRGFKEKTAQSKAEARRRGESVSDDEDALSPHKRGSKGNHAQKPQSDTWKRPRKAKVKVEHQTYEQIVHGVAGQEPQATGIGKIYDATSGEIREISLADISSATWTPSTDMIRIPEVRHNLRLIVDAAKGDLDGLAREAKALEVRKDWVHNEDARLRRKIQEEADLVERLQKVHLIIDEIKTQSDLSGSDYEPSLEVFSPHIEKLVTLFKMEYDTYGLDEIVVSAIAPVVRQSLASWQPLQDPAFLVDIFRSWRGALKISAMEEKTEIEVDVYGARTIKSKPTVQDVAMTPYESLLWNSWLPKVRSCINNNWSPLDANPAIRLYEMWTNILPPFIRDNVLDQLVLPKVYKGIAEWQSPSGGSALQAIVLPWLPYVGLRTEELLGEVKRKVKSLLRTWMVSDGIPQDLIAWKDVFGSKDWNSMMLKYVVPKLGVTLREDFKVNPRQQDMAPLELILPWRSVLTSSVFSQLLETEFFSKWLDVLHVWLIQPNASFEEVAQWYAFWKGAFPQEVLDLPGVTHGFTCGLQLMNKAIELGPEMSSKLPRPNHTAPSKTSNSSHQGTPKTRPAPRATEITFRSIVEEFAALHDLLFIPTGRVHEKSRVPLFRVSPSMDSKGGVLVFILDDAVWASEGGDYRAITLEEMVLRANKPR